MNKYNLSNDEHDVGIHQVSFDLTPVKNGKRACK
jgi:hypothetical protein